jgi:hypothetical protein
MRNTMVFSMPFCKKLKALLLVGLLTLMAAAWGEGVTVKTAVVTVAEEGVLLNADFDVELTPALEEALTRGVPLAFVLNFELIEPRWYWLNKTIVSMQQERRISFNPLTRVYRFSMGPLNLSFNSLADAVQALTQLSAIKVAEAGALKKGAHYRATVQMHLDVAQLPKPFQVDALSSSDWKLSSRPFEWVVSP